MIPEEAISDDAPGPLNLLLENHRAFLGFLERRAGDRALAEDILQDAFIKLIHRPHQAPVDEGVFPWFYRTLRNATIDRFRRQRTANRAIEAFAHELESHASPDPEMAAEICGCVGRLVDSLKPEYAEALRSIEINGTPVKVFAEQHLRPATFVGAQGRQRAPLQSELRPGGWEV